VLSARKIEFPQEIFCSGEPKVINFSTRSSSFGCCSRINQHFLKNTIKMNEISIIIPHYNNPNGVERLINSIGDQKVEILIIDDQSEESEISKLKLKINKKENVRLLHNFKKKGAGTARNIGIENSTGKWLLFADSDDYYTENAIEKVLSDIKETESSSDSREIDIIFYPPTSKIEGSEKKSRRHIEYESLVNNHISSGSNRIRRRFVVPWSKALRSSLIKKEKILFDETIAANDVMFSLKSGTSARKIKSSDSVIYCVTDNPNSLTKTKSQRSLKARLLVTIRYNNYISRMGLEKSSQCSLFSAIYIFCVKQKTANPSHLIKLFIKRRWRIF